MRVNQVDIRTRRVYDESHPDDGLRILVDRLWPRGLSKEDANFDIWARDLAPSDALRRWYHDHPDDGDAFRERYFRELGECGAAVDALLQRIGDRRATLLYASRRSEGNNADALKAYLERAGSA